MEKKEEEKTQNTARIYSHMRAVLDMQLQRDKAKEQYEHASAELKSAKEELTLAAQEENYFGEKEFGYGSVAVNQGKGKLTFEGTDQETDHREVLKGLFKKFRNKYVQVTLAEKKIQIRDEIVSGTKNGEYLRELGYEIVIEPSIVVKPKPWQGV